MKPFGRGSERYYRTRPISVVGPLRPVYRSRHASQQRTRVQYHLRLFGYRKDHDDSVDIRSRADGILGLSTMVYGYIYSAQTQSEFHERGEISRSFFRDRGGQAGDASWDDNEVGGWE